MALFIISYDLRKQRNYQPLYDCLNSWKATRLLESLWLADLVGPASAIRDILRASVDADDGIAVLGLTRGFDWATLNCQTLGTNWLNTKSP